MENSKKIKNLDEIINPFKNFEFLEYFEKSSIKKYSRDLTKYPEDWKRINFKTYPRFKQIKLKNLLKKTKDNLLKTLSQRKSKRIFRSYRIKSNEISYILSGAAITRVFKNDYEYFSYRAYPSGGARYPLELYLMILNCKKIKPGLYHYNVRYHSLEYMWGFSKNQLNKIFGSQSKFLSKSSILIIITGIIKRGLSRYGERYLRYVFIEAGHLAQNILLLSTKIGLKTCPIGGFKDQEIKKLLNLTDEELELPLYVIAVGK